VADRPRKTCGECGRNRPEDETVLVPGSRSGNFRRATTSTWRRVCRDCTTEHVAFTRRMQAEGRYCPLDDNTPIRWSRAAEYFGIDITGLYRSHSEHRTHSEHQGGSR
jgi:hypothetical protein